MTVPRLTKHLLLIRTRERYRNLAQMLGDPWYVRRPGFPPLERPLRARSLIQQEDNRHE